MLYRKMSSQLSIGDRAEIHGLVTRPDLNGKLGTLVLFHKDVQRWQFNVEKSKEVVRARPSNLRRDRIEVVAHDGPKVAIMRPQWKYRDDVDKSAHCILVEHVLARRTKTFTGSIMIHMHGHAEREFKTPPVTILPSSKKLWNTDDLMAAIKTALPSSIDVQEAPVPWNHLSESHFSLSMTHMIMQAHSTSSTVYIAIRTEENTRRFGMLHVMSGDSPDLMVPLALLGKGTVICTPTEAIAYHKDNMVKLPTTMSLSQASRKVADMVLHGIEVPCPICLELPSQSEQTIFMPCECRVSIHLSCMQDLLDRNTTICPVCRSPLGELELR